jgi:subtilisin-like proprotein convertase family protein
MKKQLLIAFASVFMFCNLQAQTDNLWSKHKGISLVTSKNIQRPDFPTDFDLYDLNFNSMKQMLSNAQDRFVSRNGVVISLPNKQGVLEQFEVFEASNFTPDFQAQNPDIRAYAGRSLQDKYATLRMSISPQGIQTMVFRTDNRNEFMEPYSADGKVYAIYNSSRNKGTGTFACHTIDNGISESVSKGISNTKRSSASELLTFRLALACTGEYGVAFGGSAGALAQMNTTMTRVNGVFEKDFSVHLAMIDNTAIRYTAAGSDPFSPAANMNNWNAELQSNLTLVIGEANYDIGHLFGASGGGGNAGCIGCVCVDGEKGSGITSPGSGLASGDTFDIDYVAHEMGHQFGGNHTFSNSFEGSGVNMEVGSGSTIMGYAGITGATDVQANSDDYFHYATIFQVENNMELKTCPTRTPLLNIAPVVNAGADYTIPKGTPFMLTGSGTDPNGNALNYCWEQINNSNATNIDALSAAAANKLVGPNWKSYTPVSSPIRYFPNMKSVVANQAFTKTPLSNAVNAFKIEALSTVARTLSFVVTARDIVADGGLTDTDGMIVTVSAATGVVPFAVNYPTAAAVTWAGGSNQTVTWNFAGSTANGINAAFVDIYLSKDVNTAAGTFTYPTLLASKVPNDGTEVITVPNSVGTTNRVLIKGYNHIFYDISNNNFPITAAPNSFSIGFNGVAEQQNKQACQGGGATYTISYTAYAGFTGTTTFSAGTLPAGVTVSFSPTSRTTTGNVTMTVTTTGAVATGVIPITVTATSGGTPKTAPFYLEIFSANFGTQALTTPANNATALTTSGSLTWAANTIAATFYEVQIARDAAFTNIVSTATVTSLTAAYSGLLEATDYYWRVLPKNPSCSGAYSAGYKFTTGSSNCNYSYSNNTNLAVVDGTAANAAGTTATKTIVVPGSVTGNLNDVIVGLTMTHTYVQDFILELVHPDGTIIKLMNRSCDEGASATSGVTYSFNFTNAAAVQLPSGSCLSPAPITGNVKPADPITVFYGKAASGTWTLRATDWFVGDLGSIGNWSLNLCVAEPLGIADNTLANFALYPNPNKGNFNVQFNSTSNKEVSILVHDMRGRTILNNKYSNTGLFSQNVQLDQVQAGVYLVTVQDGDKKVVKRIIIE